MTDNGLEVLAARIEGSMATMAAEIKGQIAELAAQQKFGDNTNAQLIQGLIEGQKKLEDSKADRDDTERAHTRIDRLEDRISTNFRLALTGLVFPFLVAVAVFIFHAATKVGR